MIRMTLLVLFLFISLFSFSQISDFIVVKKKNGRTIETFMAGKPILFKTNAGKYINGHIDDIRNDSVFVLIYNTQTLSTKFGFQILDTVSRSVIGINYHDISRIKIHESPDRGQKLAGPLLMLGGSGYILLNVFNSVGHNEPLTEKRNVRNIGYAAGAIALGYLVSKHFFVDNFSSKWHKFVYVNMN